MSALGKRVAFGLAAGLLLLAFVRGALFELYSVPTVSMSPTLVRGDWLLVHKSFSSTPQFHRGDVVVFERDGETYVKRIVGLPGDRIALNAEGLTVNGQSVLREHLDEVQLDADGQAIKRSLSIPSYALLREGWDNRTWTIARFRDDSASQQQVTVPPERLFVLGDNRSESHDSRQEEVGTIPLTSVRGRVTHVVWSRSDQGFRSNRWWHEIQ